MICNSINVFPLRSVTITGSLRNSAVKSSRQFGRSRIGKSFMASKAAAPLDGYWLRRLPLGQIATSVEVPWIFSIKLKGNGAVAENLPQSSGLTSKLQLAYTHDMDSVAAGSAITKIPGPGIELGQSKGQIQKSVFPNQIRLNYRQAG